MSGEFKSFGSEIDSSGGWVMGADEWIAKREQTRESTPSTNNQNQNLLRV